MTISTQLFPYFQPIVGSANGQIVGYEALARRFDLEGNVKSAGELFLHPDISDKQLIEWDRNVRRQALQRFSELNDNSYLTLNISAAWIDYIEDFSALPTLKILDEFDIDKNRIIIEITETQGDLDKLLKAVEMYRKYGLKIAIDDFGAGFSQLERVMAIQPDIIKLDMQLFQNAARGGAETDVVHLLSRLAKRTGCKIVCEGVETNEDFLFGLSCGAQYMQGYLFSPATANFQDSKKYFSQIDALRETFLARALEIQTYKNQFNDRIRKLIYYLQAEVAQTCFSYEKLSTELFKDSGLLHFYVCDNHGNQITPNFNFLDNAWVADKKQLGFNWAWRPYFYEVLSFESNHRIVTSERYRDFSTDTLCKTFALRLDETRVLLVDVVADWL
ncbi:MAG: EAL domain-containing protein [Methylococcales bacterium]|nr:EAL domain-containing protein [Methylococcales bacterium]